MFCPLLQNDSEYGGRTLEGTLHPFLKINAFTEKVICIHQNIQILLSHLNKLLQLELAHAMTIQV